ncbi:hypothetical protein [Chloroflexus aggregans]|uniref:hypothetical protein n=1 Tax=Chloroflexus aggregans TaxID=152260 RepID=UPI00059BC802|nr:hypothetical protein [Chloroflexus aggregans]
MYNSHTGTAHRCAQEAGNEATASGEGWFLTPAHDDAGPSVQLDCTMVQRSASRSHESCPFAPVPDGCTERRHPPTDDTLRYQQRHERTARFIRGGPLWLDSRELRVPGLILATTPSGGGTTH